MIHVVLWKWRQGGLKHKGYEALHVNTMVAMIARNLKEKHRVICITDDPTGVECEAFELWEDYNALPNPQQNLPSCFRRLKLYDQKTQRSLGIKPGERIVGLDLDTIVCGELDDLFTTPGLYIGWELPVQINKGRVFNGSLQMFDAGDQLQFIWSEFKGNETRIKVANAGYHGSDQAWISYNLVGRDGSVGLRHPELTSYPLQARIQNKIYPKTKLCFFHGINKPWDSDVSKRTPWVRDYWRI